MSRKWERGVLLLFSLALAFHLAIYLTHAWATIRYPYQLDFGEGAVLGLAEIMRRHEPPYRPPELSPFLAVTYAPLFPWLASLLLGPLPTFGGGRFLSEASTMGLTMILAAWLRARCGTRAAVAGAAFFLANPVVLGWTCLERVDGMGLCLSVAGVLLAQGQWGRRAWGMGPAICFTLAFFVKQVFVAAPVSVFLALWLEGKPARGQAWRFALVQAGMVALGLLAVQALCQGPFLQVIFGGNVLPYRFEQVGQYVSSYAVFVLPLLVLARRAGQAPRALKIYALASVWMVAGSGRFGADYNYFLELHASLCLLAAWGLSQDGAREGLRVLLGLVQVLLIGVFVPLGTTFYSAWAYLPYETLPLWAGGEPKYMVLGREAGRQLQEILDRHPGPVIAENMGPPLLAGRIPWMCDPSTFKALADCGRWDEELVLAPLREGRVKIVLLQRIEQNPRFTQRFLDTVKTRYRYAGQFGVDHVFLAP